MAPEITQKWLKYLRLELPTVAFKSTTSHQNTHLNQNTANVENVDAAVLNRAESLGKNICLDNE